MKAMILAAGLGTRLRPLTDDRPKALVEIGGRTLLEIAIARLRAAGVTEIVVNVHHFAASVRQFLREKNHFGMRIEIAQEDILLDTGGGLKNVAPFFLEDRRHEPFVLHNVDVLTDIDLAALLAFHRERHALASLAVQKRVTSRYLLFDQDGLLCGRRSGEGGEPERVRPAVHWEARAFSGLHVLSPRIFAKMQEVGAFSVIDAYLRLASTGETIVGFPADAYYWRDLGRPDQLQQAEEDLRAGLVKLA